MKEQKRPAMMVRIIAALLGTLLGLGVAVWASERFKEAGLNVSFNIVAVYTVVLALGFGLLFFFLCGRVANGFGAILRRIETSLADIPAQQISIGFIGLLLGLVIAFLLTPILSHMQTTFLYVPLSVLLYVGLGWAGVRFMLSREEWATALIARRATQSFTKKQDAPLKLLDTSAIIDGRIFDIARTGFVDGIMVVPEFVLKELQRIADSADDLKRNRGRRGLELLDAFRLEQPERIQVSSEDFPDVQEVDIKLLKLAEKLSGCVVTNDYNLNKVAGLTGLTVLNVNELANAVKPVMLPGERMQVYIRKGGKEAGQGVAYLDDGTMIVIENGKSRIGSTVTVVVSSVLQTAAGRMIFAQIS